MKPLHSSRGIALVEIVIGASIIAACFVAIIGIYASLARISAQSLPRVQAAMLAEEGLEALRSMRDESYAGNIVSLSNGSIYGIEWRQSISSYRATTSIASISGNFVRTFTVADAYRDGSYNLASSGTVDPNTKLVTMNVAWNTGSATSTFQLQSYISNIFNN